MLRIPDADTADKLNADKIAAGRWAEHLGEADSLFVNASTWGLMLADGRQYLGSAWWMTTFPGLAITFTVLGVVFVGDWLRDAMDPRMRGRG